MIEEIHVAFAGQHQPSSGHFAELVNRGWNLLKAGQLYEAEAVCRTAIADTPDDPSAWMTLGWALMQQERFEDAINAFDRVLHNTHPGDGSALHALAVHALVSKVLALFRLRRYQAAAAVFERFQERVDPSEPAALRSLAVILYSLNGSLLAISNQPEEAIAAWDRVVKYVRVDDPPDLRGVAVESLDVKGDILTEMDRHEDAEATWERIVDYVRVDDPSDLRHKATKLLSAKSDALAKLNRHEEAIAAWDRVVEYVRIDDPPELRRKAVQALFGKVNHLLNLMRHRELGSVLLSISDYVHPDDSTDLRHTVATALANGGGLLNVLREWGKAEVLCKRATNIEPTNAESWRILAEAILGQDNSTRLAEAEDCARRAVALTLDDSGALHTLSDVLACRSNWTEALDLLEHSLRTGGGDFQRHEWPGLTDSLIEAIAAGYGTRVKQMMEGTKLVEMMEPLLACSKGAVGRRTRTPACRDHGGRGWTSNESLPVVPNSLQSYAGLNEMIEIPNLLNPRSGVRGEPP